MLQIKLNYFNINLYKVKYTDSVKPRIGYVLAIDYANAEKRIKSKLTNLLLINNIEQVGSEGIYGKPNLVLK